MAIIGRDRKSRWDVSTHSGRFDELEAKRKLHRTLLGGTLSMREAGEEFLPMESGEDSESYSTRLSKSVLYNGYKRTIDYLAGKVFSTPLELNDTAPQYYRDLADDIDMSGRNLHRFSWDLFKSGLSSGISFIFVDFKSNGAPPVVTSAGRRMKRVSDTVGDRPYWTMIDPSRIFRMAFPDSGPPKLLRCHIITEEVIRGAPGEGFWEETVVEVIRVYYAAGEVRSDGEVSNFCSFERWTKAKDERGREVWALSGEAEEMPPIKDIPLIPFYSNYAGYMDSEPEFEDLAQLQWSHWLKRSDFDHTLHHSAGVPTLVLPGFEALDAAGLEVGAMRTVLTPSENSRPYWLEVTGSGLRILQNDLAGLETRILLLGLQPLMSKPSSGQLVTATERMIDQENVNNQLEAYALSLKDTIDLAMFVTSQWGSRSDWPFGSDVIRMNSDFSFSMKSDMDKQFLLQMRAARDLSFEGLYELGKRYDIFPEDFSASVEAERLLGKSLKSDNANNEEPKDDPPDRGDE